MKKYLAVAAAMLACVWGCGKGDTEAKTSTEGDMTKTLSQADKVQAAHDAKDRLNAIDAQRKQDMEDAGL